MTEKMAFDVLNFVFSELDLDPKFHIYFWGGEPFLNFKVMKSVLDRYPQFLYHSTTNGAMIDEPMYDFFMRNRNFAFTWSLGSAYEIYGGVKEKVEHEYWARRLVMDNPNNNVNFMVVNYDRFMEDFEWLLNNVTRNIMIDIATRVDHKDEDLEKFADQYFDILVKYRDQPDIFYGMNPAIHSNLYYRELGMKSQVKDFHYCRSGLDRLFIDMTGGIWQCDGMYLNQHNKLGDIRTGIDYNKLALAWEIGENKEKYLGRHCEACELYKQCPRNKCFGLNLECKGDMFIPEDAWCKMCKVLFKVTQKYIELQKREGVLCLT
jgi:sulfatase maturation enzyme AslB (radical SAM superfamily)